jgi:peptidyl-tRNA hydrolase
MSDNMKIDVALVHLEAGKFSFRMVDAIKDHISGLENELEVVRELHASAIRDLKRQEYANWRLEGELRKLNAKIYALLKANLLTEKAYAGMSFAALKMGVYVEVARKFAAAGLAQVMADVKSGKLQSQGADAAAKIYALLKEIMPTQSTLEEMKPYAHQMGEYLAVAGKFAAATFEWVMADVKSGKLQSQCADAAAKLYASLKEIMPTQSTLREMTAYAQKWGEYFAVAWKFVAAQVAKASAYLASLHKNVA